VKIVNVTVIVTVNVANVVMMYALTVNVNIVTVPMMILGCGKIVAANRAFND